MWGGVVSLVRHGLRRRPRRRTARVVDESATAGDLAGGAPREREGPATAAAGALLARAVLAMARGAVGLDGEVGGGGAEEAWVAATGWRPAARGGDELGHLMVHDSLRYVIYA
ncbi:unnamed protein product [Urochloa humidicola]